MIWLPAMFCDELDMLDVRLTEVFNWRVTKDPMPDVMHVLVEAPVTHKGIPKPFYLAEQTRVDVSGGNVVHMICPSLPDSPDPWVREHAQRDAAWQRIDRYGKDSDWVLISDLDEIPSHELLDCLNDEAFGLPILPDPVAIRMRVFIHAVDWEVPQDAVPPQCVAATVGYIRRHGGSLSAVRDARSAYSEFQGGGMHFSWLGTTEQQAYKLNSKSCHTELLGTREAMLIGTGDKYRHGTRTREGLPMIPVKVDGSWPALIRDRRVPAEWYRPA